MTNSRAKGARAELEVVHLMRPFWPRVERTSDGRAQMGRGDLAHGPTDVHLEVKHREALNVWEAMDQAIREAQPGHLPVLAFRRNRTAWYGATLLDGLLPLLRIRDDFR